MRISTMLFPYQAALQAGEYSVAELLAVLRAAGMQGLELAWEGIKQNQALFREILLVARKEQLQFPCLDVRSSMASGDEQENLRVLENCRQAFTFCRDELDCPVALLYGSAPPAGMSNQEGRRHYGEMLARCAELAADFGVTVCIEDFGVTPTFTAASKDCLEVIRNSRHQAVKFNFDNGNFLLADECPLDALEAVKDLICHVHLKDMCRHVPNEQQRGLRSASGICYRSCPLGEGEGEVISCLQRLRELGYTGWLSSESGNTPATGAAAVRFIAQNC
jgi:hydroxypyruvate isomerase